MTDPQHPTPPTPNPNPEGTGTPRDARSAPPSAATTAITVSTAVVGGLALFVAGTSAAFGATFSSPGPGFGFGPWSGMIDRGEDWFADNDWVDDSGDWSEEVVDDSGESGVSVADSLDVTGVTELEIDVAAAGLTVDFGDVEFAELETSDSSDAVWNFFVDGETLLLESPDEGLSATGGCLFGCAVGTGDDARRVTLTLPRSLAERGTLDADVSVAAGSVRMDGDFRDLGIDVQTGEVTVNGSARSLDLDVSTGSATVSLADVDRLEADIETGEAEIALGGAAPASVEVGVDLGSMTVDLPEEQYRVDIDDGPSTVRNELDVDAKSKHRVSAELGAGELVLR